MRKQFVGAAAPTELAAAIGAGDTTVQLVAADRWPTGDVGPFPVVIDRGLPAEEKLLCSALNTGPPITLTVAERGYDGTTAAAHDTGADVRHVLDALTVDELNAFATHPVVYPHEGTQAPDTFVYIGSGTTYTVPAGQVWYLMRYYTGSYTGYVQVDDAAGVLRYVWQGQAGLRQHHAGPALPVIVAAGRRIHQSGGYLYGFLVPEDPAIVPVIINISGGATYTVPAGRRMVMLTAAVPTSIAYVDDLNVGQQFGGGQNDAADPYPTRNVLHKPYHIQAGSVIRGLSSNVDPTVVTGYEVIL